VPNRRGSLRCRNYLLIEVELACGKVGLQGRDIASSLPRATLEQRVRGRSSNVQPERSRQGAESLGCTGRALALRIVLAFSEIMLARCQKRNRNRAREIKGTINNRMRIDTEVHLFYSRIYNDATPSPVLHHS
jgi:hypothetical protein